MHLDRGNAARDAPLIEADRTNSGSSVSSTGQDGYCFRDIQKILRSSRRQCQLQPGAEPERIIMGCKFQECLITILQGHS